MRDYNENKCTNHDVVMSTDLSHFSNSKKHIETVEKCLEYNKGLQDKVIGGNVKFMERLGRELQFSENSIQGNLQFAQGTDVTTPPIGNWTFASLNMLVQEVGSNINPDCKLSLAFPDKSIPSYKCLVDRIAGNTGILPEFAGDNAMLPPVRKLDTYGLSYQPALHAGRTMINSRDIMNARKLGVGNFDERGIGQLIAYNSVNLITQAFTRKKQLLNQAIFFNGFSFGGETISSNIPTANYIQLSDSIGALNSDGSTTYDTTDPTYTPFIAITNTLNRPEFLKYRNYIRGVLVNSADLISIMNHPSVKPVTTTLLAANGSLGNKKMKVAIGEQVQELNAYYAPGFDFPLIPDDGVWQSQNADGTSATTPNDAQLAQGAQNFFVPRGRMFVLLDLTEFGGQLGSYHLTYNELDPNMEAPAMGLFTGVFNRNLQNSDITNRVDIVAALAGAPAVYMPEACFVVTGLYSNVT